SLSWGSVAGGLAAVDLGEERGPHPFGNFELCRTVRGLTLLIRMMQRVVHSSAETGDGEPVASGGPQVIWHVPGDLPRDPRSGRRRGADRVGNSRMPGGFRALPGQHGRPFG